jgi:hypothetical protein
MAAAQQPHQPDCAIPPQIGGSTRLQFAVWRRLYAAATQRVMPTVRWPIAVNKLGIIKWNLQEMTV